jgi:uncharacterized iron-regulated membrane protein
MVNWRSHAESREAPRAVKKAARLGAQGKGPLRRRSLRGLLVLLHRFVGLSIASFLTIAGLTGAVIAWHDELDAWLNPDLYRAVASGPALDPLELAARVERMDSKAWVTYLPLTATPGEAFDLFVSPRIDPGSGEPYVLDYNQVFLDPANGAFLGKRAWGEPRLDRAHVIPFLYALHYSLCIPEFHGVNKWGVWLMGGVALFWIVDCFVGFALTLPPIPRDGIGVAWRRNWMVAWRIKWPSGPYRLTLDIHRAFGLWLWTLLLIMAISAACLNLDREVARPLIGLVSTLTPSLEATSRQAPAPPSFSLAKTIDRAKKEAVARKFKTPLGAVGYVDEAGVFRADFFERGEVDGPFGLGPAMLYFDAINGDFLGERLPWGKTSGDLFLALQLPLHSGKILGLPGRILVSCMGIAVATLSIAGVVIWAKKRRARATFSAHGARAGRSLLAFRF